MKKKVREVHTAGIGDGASHCVKILSVFYDNLVTLIHGVLMSLTYPVIFKTCVCLTFYISLHRFIINNNIRLP